MRILLASCVLVVFGLATSVADEFIASIKKVETKGDKSTITLWKKGMTKDFSFPVAKDVKVSRGTYNKGTMKADVGDPVPDGLKDDALKNAEKGLGVTSYVTTHDKNNITAIVLIGGKKKKAD